MARIAKTDEKRKELLEKALQCFTRYGYAKTTLDDVAKEAGMNKATLYHYFKNKEALFLQVMVAMAGNAMQELALAANKQKTVEKKCIHFFSERLHYYLKMIRLSSLSRETLLVLQPLFDQIYQPQKEEEITYVAALIQEYKPECSKKQAIEYTRLVFNAVDALKHEGVFIENLLENKEEDVKAMKTKIVNLLSLLLEGIKHK
jgi:AcrR family transcriptional regulator